MFRAKKTPDTFQVCRALWPIFLKLVVFVSEAGEAWDMKNTEKATS